MKIALAIAGAVLMLPLLVLVAIALGPASLVVLFLVLCALLVVAFQHVTVGHTH